MRRCHTKGRAMFTLMLLAGEGGGVYAAGTIGATSLTPNSVPVNTPTGVLVTSVITDPSLIPSSVNLQRLDAVHGTFANIGTLYDDGTHGDAVAGDGTFSLQLSFTEGAPFPVTLRVSAAFKGSLVRVFSSPLTLTVVGSPPASLAITSPANLSFVNLSPVTVIGTVSDPAAAVTVNGISSPSSSGSFAVSVPLLEGNNLLTAAARNSQGEVSTASIQVTLDTTPPRVTIDSPFNGLVTTDTSITVTGKANDLVVGTVNDQQVQVTVNGVAAQVANRSFRALNIPLSLGDNTITATGVDRAGNGATAKIGVRRDAPTQPQIKLISGNNQSGPIGSQLPSPLVIVLVDGAGNPVANQTVVFSVTQNNGTLDSAGATEVAITNLQGQAQVHWTLGTHAGAGNNVVQADAAGFAGTAIFTATGSPTSAANINVDAGNDQNGVAGQALPFPLVVAVTDSGHNRLVNIPVTYQVKQGSGSFNGQPSLTTNTDSDGRAAAILTLGPQDGIENNVVEASFPGNAGFPAAFTASGHVPGNPAATRITGVVLDNSNNPIPGATVRAFQYNVPAQVSSGLPPNIAAQTDQQGQFSLLPAPVGFTKLIVDGSTVQKAGKWPNLEYELVTVPGQNNTVGLPIHLLPLDTQNLLCVSDTAGGTLTLPQVPGFSLTVAAGSATFPGSSRSGCISVTPVHSDKIPMVPGFGQQPRFIVTIQPAGTTFNPPAAITLPNAEGLKPREVTEMYSFDHDLATFVSVGTATVSDDGTVIKSDPGVGVTKAGWMCGGNNTPTGTAGTALVSVRQVSDRSPIVGDLVTVVADGGPTPGSFTSVVWDNSVLSLVQSNPVNTGNTIELTLTFRALAPGDGGIHLRYTCQAGVSASADIQVNAVQFGVTSYQSILSANYPGLFVAKANGSGFDQTSSEYFIQVKANVTANGPSAAVADYRIGFIQNVQQAQLDFVFVHTLVQIRKIALPILDALSTSDPLVAVQVPNTSGQVLNMQFVDKPTIGSSWKDPRLQLDNQLQTVTRNEDFSNWLVAQNMKTGKITYLKYLEWKLGLQLTIDMSQPLTADARISVTSKSLSVGVPGDGVGPWSPVTSGPISNNGNVETDIPR
jgi:hypothetical protein